MAEVPSGPTADLVAMQCAFTATAKRMAIAFDSVFPPEWRVALTTAGRLAREFERVPPGSTHGWYPEKPRGWRP